jgi:hypothetical protein
VDCVGFVEREGVAIIIELWQNVCRGQANLGQAARRRATTDGQKHSDLQL